MQLVQGDAALTSNLRIDVAVRMLASYMYEVLSIDL